ncbi:MAG: glycosyltransferase family 39 protein [Caulobacteraceae bacterium]|nr:glycosyltransferase family 39 protein [Caulobacter sp.]
MFLPGQSRLPPVDRDEVRYAQSVTQMLETGDFINIRYQGYARYLQPAGIYWLQAASVSLLSTPQARAIWAYRVPSLLAACAAVLLTAYVGSVLFGPAAGFGAALMMAFCVLLGFEARMAKIDASLLAVTLLAQAMLARVWTMRGRPMPHPRLTAALFWAALGVGLMLKGPIILLVAGTTVLGVGLSSREWAWLRRLHAGWGVLITLAIALPWLVAIGVVSHGAFFTKAVGHNIGDKLKGGEQGHGQPPGYYLALFSATFWPGALALVMALPWAWRERRRDAVRFCTWWVIPAWLVFEAIPTKLPHYVLPLYPALACLAAAAALAPQGWARPRGWRWAGAAYGVLWLALGVALAFLGPVALARIQHASDPLATALALAAALAVLAAAGLLLARRRGWALGAAGVGAALAATNVYAVSAPALTSVFVSPRIAAEARRVAPCGAATVFASSAYSEPSVVFLTRTETALVGPARAADFVAADRRCRLALVDARQLPAFAAEAAHDGFTPRPVGRVEGRNYSTGKRLDLTFYAGSPGKIGPPPAP